MRYGGMDCPLEIKLTKILCHSVCLVDESHSLFEHTFFVCLPQNTTRRTCHLNIPYKLYNETMQKYVRPPEVPPRYPRSDFHGGLDTIVLDRHSILIRSNERKRAKKECDGGRRIFFAK